MGILIPAFAGIFIISIIVLVNTRLYKKNIKLFNKAGKILLGLFSLWFISFVIVVVVINVSAVSDEDEKVDCVIVLGAGLKGEKPSAVLEERLIYTLKYIEKNPDSKVIVTGGQGFGEVISEAEAMMRYLVNHGLSKEVIIKEEKSTSTFENMTFSKQVYENTYNKKLNRVMIVTNDFHLFRAKILARRVGLEPYGISSKTPWYLYPNVYLREYIGLFKSLIFDK